jgi:hypothetical protein
MRQRVPASGRNLPFPESRRYRQLKEQRLLTAPTFQGGQVHEHHEPGRFQ